MIPEELLFRRIIVCSSGLIYWAGVLIQGCRIRKRIGHSPNLRPKGPKEKALWFGWFLVIFIWIVQPLLVGITSSAPGLRLLPPVMGRLSLAFGLILVAFGYGGTLWAYAAMGDTWRIGVNKEEKTKLVSAGPYRWVRHPIYLLQIIMLAGNALLLPTPLSFATLVLHYFCVR